MAGIHLSITLTRRPQRFLKPFSHRTYFHTFVTGLLGTNVGGISRSENPLAFALVCLTLTSPVLLLVGFFC